MLLHHQNDCKNNEGTVNNSMKQICQKGNVGVFYKSHDSMMIWFRQIVILTLRVPAVDFLQLQNLHYDSNSKDCRGMGHNLPS